MRTSTPVLMKIPVKPVLLPTILRKALTPSLKRLLKRQDHKPSKMSAKNGQMECKQFTGKGLFFLWFCLEKAAEMFLISSHNLKVQ
jgi:hypothetical protein